MQDANAQNTNASAKEVYGHLIPVHEQFLIVPKMAVLEVVGMESIAVETSGPAWLLGRAQWHGKDLAVVSVEAMAGGKMPARTRRTRAVVMNGFGGHLDDGLFMLLAQGYPHLTALNAAALVAQPPRPEDKDIALSRVRLASTEAIIPNLENIELRIATAVGQMQGSAASFEDWQPGKLGQLDKNSL